jgi:hypothetical protein
MLEPYITLGEETKGYPKPGLMYKTREQCPKLVR